ncbi:hypothetical protein BGW37DRAFT_449959 [Umbelopsis sp. PMI_123]|nr:hypothetical protein BGW37DRAFT_449959 [Umbelopsis sp. PMI_123]
MALSVKDASGRHISLLNSTSPCGYFYTDSSNTSSAPSSPSSSDDGQHSPTRSHMATSRSSSTYGKRRYHCMEPGCNKSFTTSGHLARHNRIHTGEKNFACLYPGCPSRFSRQDNMMQHYRTHMSARSRSRVHSQNGSLHANTAASNIARPHAHTRIHSDSSAITPLNQNQHSVIPSDFPQTNRLEYFSAPSSPSLPPLHQMIQDSQSLDISLPPPRAILPVPKNHRQVDENNSSSGLLQLAHIVSTFG